MLRKAEAEALRSQTESLNGEVAAYEDLRSGKERVALPPALDDLPRPCSGRASRLA